MATLYINESREYIIFQAFAEHRDFKEALAVLERYDEEHPDTKIFGSAKDKQAMRRSFSVFKEAESIVAQGNGRPDYDNPVIVERMRTVISHKILPMRAVVINNGAQGVTTKKANVGSIMYHYAKDYQKLDARDKQRMTREATTIKHEQAITEKSGRTGHGGYDGKSVISQRSGDGDKSMSQILYERGREERKTGRA